MAKKKNKFDPTGVIPTDEQQKIIDYDIKKDDVVETSNRFNKSS